MLVINQYFIDLSVRDWGLAPRILILDSIEYENGEPDYLYFKYPNGQFACAGGVFILDSMIPINKLVPRLDRSTLLSPPA